MLTRLFRRCAQLGRSLARALRQGLATATRPAEPAVVAGTLADLTRSRPALVAENAFLRQQLLVLRRSIKRPRCTPIDRALLVLLASRLRAWHQALLIVQPETVLRWHRQGFRLFWHHKSRAKAHPPRVPEEVIALIHIMALDNRLWAQNAFAMSFGNWAIVSQNVPSPNTSAESALLHLENPVRRGAAF